MLVEETEEAGVIPADQATYVQNVFELSDKTVRDVMVPRDKVVTLSLSRVRRSEVLEAARETRPHAHAGVGGRRPTTSSASSTPRTCSTCSA